MTDVLNALHAYRSRLKAEGAPTEDMITIDFAIAQATEVYISQTFWRNICIGILNAVPTIRNPKAHMSMYDQSKIADAVRAYFATAQTLTKEFYDGLIKDADDDRETYSERPSVPGETI